MKIALSIIVATLSFTSLCGAQSPSSTTSGAAAADDKSIRPFHVKVPEAALADMRKRIAATRWPEKETVADKSQGVQLATMQALAKYWGTGYDWRKCEAKLNAVPNFITAIDGVDIHFIHVRSKEKNALPLIITHGWPGSIIEQMKIIGPLTDPVAHGGKAEDAFDVVIPSLPGYGFSGKPTTTGWDPQRVARAWAVLMNRLGYTRYVAQGGDWGNAVTEQMALQQPPGLIGIHTNMPATVPPDIDKAAFAGAPAPSGLSADEKQAYDQLDVRPRCCQSGADRTGLRGKIRRPDARRHSRQRHPLLANEYGGLFGSTLLGEQARLFRPERCPDLGRRERLSG
jgi:pimeloyl-ACP methyl ester carboxylesterase